jgi:hypothetical protein
MDRCTRTATSPLAAEVSATSPSIPAVLRPALRCVTCRTLTSVLDRLRSISFGRFLTFGQSCSCAALKIRCRSRRTSSPQARQSNGIPGGDHVLRSVHPHRVHRGVGQHGVQLALRFRRSWLLRLKGSPAHVSTLSGRAAARYPAGYAGRPAEGRSCCPGFPSPYGAPAFASWASCSRQGLRPSLPPAYRRRLTALPDPDGVSTFRMRELRPGWAPPQPRGQRCSHGRRRFTRPPLAVPPRPGPAPRFLIPPPRALGNEASAGVHSRSPDRSSPRLRSRMGPDALRLLPRAPHPAVTRDARQGGDWP